MVINLEKGSSSGGKRLVLACLLLCLGILAGFLAAGMFQKQTRDEAALQKALALAQSLERERDELALKLKQAQAAPAKVQERRIPREGPGQEELAPGFDSCAQKAKSDFDLKDCFQDAASYWDGRLKAAYHKAAAGCEQGENPAQCKNRLKSMEVGWIRFKELMGEFIYSGSVERQPLPGSLDRMLGTAFMAEETKRQCQRLENLAGE